MSGPLISWVNRVDDTQCHDEDLENVVLQIRKGTWQEIVDKYRAACRAGKTEKNWLPAFTPSGRFKERNAKALVWHSGVIIADLDKLGAELDSVRKQLESSKHVYTVFASIGGNGLKAFFHVSCDDPAQHLNAFRAVDKHVFELTGKRIDKSGKDVCRLCVVSSDPKIYVNRLPLPMDPLPPEPARPKPTACNGSKPSKAEVLKILACLRERPEYLDWAKIVSAVGDALSDDDAGRDAHLSGKVAKALMEKAPEYWLSRRRLRRQTFWQTDYWVRNSFGLGHSRRCPELLTSPRDSISFRSPIARMVLPIKSWTKHSRSRFDRQR